MVRGREDEGSDQRGGTVEVTFEGAVGGGTGEGVVVGSELGGVAVVVRVEDRVEMSVEEFCKVPGGSQPFDPASA